jgi:hypothetical protein
MFSAYPKLFVNSFFMTIEARETALICFKEYHEISKNGIRKTVWDLNHCHGDPEVYREKHTVGE